MGSRAAKSTGGAPEALEAEVDATPCCGAAEDLGEAKEIASDDKGSARSSAAGRVMAGALLIPSRAGPNWGVCGIREGERCHGTRRAIIER